MKNATMIAAITTTGMTTAMATMAPVDRPLLWLVVPDAVAATAVAEVPLDSLVADTMVLVDAGSEFKPDPVGLVCDPDCDVEVGSCVVVLSRSDCCQRICTLKAFTPSNAPTEKVDRKVELFVATAVSELEAKPPMARLQPYEVAKKRELTWHAKGETLRGPSAVASGQQVALVSVAVPSVTSVEHATVYPFGQ